MATQSPPEARSSVLDVFVARQPIFDARGSVYAYELLYRRNKAALSAEGASSDLMASEVLVHTFLNVGLDRMTCGAKAFVNCTRDMLVGGLCQLMSPNEVVVELLETVKPDADVISACEELVKAGYTLALDDFEYSPEFEPLLRLATIVKVDVLDRSQESLVAMAEVLRPYRVTLLAERVETSAVRDACTALGFELFQGYFFSRPELVSRRDLSSAQFTILRLMNLLRDPNSTDAQLDTVFRGDVSLSYKLLRTVNSAAMGGSGIESIRHAVRLVGRSELHKWLSLLLVTSVAASGGVTGELVQTTMCRARMCELIALDRGDRRSAEALFVVGLFSLLDAILKVPMQELLERIDLSQEVRRALLTRTGPFAQTLSLVESYERASWDMVVGEAEGLGLHPATITDLYLASLQWTRDRMGEVPAAHS